ncbi:hypothetical protein HDU76_012687 [Blyttiomyces sp. JEL0837]|nr:hypothetical protein HDU76_012687 [Blyttiomyces sp. JEL0837]
MTSFHSTHQTLRDLKIIDYIDLFFANQHLMPVRCVHHGWFMKYLETDEIESMLVLGVAAVGALLCRKRGVAEGCLKVGRRLMMGRIDCVGVDSGGGGGGGLGLQVFQTGCVLILGFMGVGNLSAVFMMTGILSKLALLLSLNVDPDDLPNAESISWLEKESRRRCWYYALVRDRFTAVLSRRECSQSMVNHSVKQMCPDSMWRSPSMNPTSASFLEYQNVTANRHPSSEQMHGTGNRVGLSGGDFGRKPSIPVKPLDYEILCREDPLNHVPELALVFVLCDEISRKKTNPFFDSVEFFVENSSAEAKLHTWFHRLPPSIHVFQTEAKWSVQAWAFGASPPWPLIYINSIYHNSRILLYKRGLVHLVNFARDSWKKEVNDKGKRVEGMNGYCGTVLNHQQYNHHSVPSSGVRALLGDIDAHIWTGLERSPAAIEDSVRALVEVSIRMGKNVVDIEEEAAIAANVAGGSRVKEFRDNFVVVMPLYLSFTLYEAAIAVVLLGILSALRARRVFGEGGEKVVDLVDETEGDISDINNDGYDDGYGNGYLDGGDLTSSPPRRKRWLPDMAASSSAAGGTISLHQHQHQQQQQYNPSKPLSRMVERVARECHAASRMDGFVKEMLDVVQGFGEEVLDDCEDVGFGFGVGVGAGAGVRRGHLFYAAGREREVDKGERDFDWRDAGLCVEDFLSENMVERLLSLLAKLGAYAYTPLEREPTIST